jgi:hypothetical protein
VRTPAQPSGVYPENLAGPEQRVADLAQRIDKLEAETEFYRHCEVERQGAWTMIEWAGWETAEEAIAWGLEHGRSC